MHLAVLGRTALYCTVQRVPRYTKWTARIIAFRICVTCYRQKLTVWPGKSILCKKNPQKAPFLVDTNPGYLTLEGPRRQTVDTGSTSGTPWNLGVWRFKLAMWETNRTWTHHIGVQVLYSFPSDRTKLAECLWFWTQQFSRDKSRNEGQLRPPVTRP